MEFKDLGTILRIGILQEMMLERGISVDYSTIYRWVQKYAAEFHKRIKWYSQRYSGNWRIDETYIKVKGK